MKGRTIIISIIVIVTAGNDIHHATVVVAE
jgi:hypothetical protein